MRTKKIIITYSITPTEVLSPSSVELARKDAWIKDIQSEIPAEWEPVIVRVTYEMFNPEIEKQRKFFEGACIPYYAIQDMDMTVGLPDSDTIKKYREDILDEMLGYNYQGVQKIHRKRKSTTDFKSVQKWNTFLQTLEETIFDNAGYEFPDSKLFWDMVKEHGYDNAKQIAIDSLQTRLEKKLNTK